MENIEILFILCILLGMSNLFIIFQNNKYPKYNYEDSILDKLNNHILELKKNNKIIENEFNMINLKMNDNILPPERKYIINFPTRGYPDNYQLMGILQRDNTETAYNLYGRQTYPGSSLYEYYVHAIINNNNIKIPLNINKEIFDEQEINISGANKDNNLFRVKLYSYNTPRYIP